MSAPVPLLNPRMFKADEPIYLAASGPSMRNIDRALLTQKKVVSINQTYELFPCSVMQVAMDYGWWRREGETFRRKHRHKLAVTSQINLPQMPGHPTIGAYKEIIYTNSRNDKLPDPECYFGFDFNPTCVKGNNGGQEAINLLYHLGARLVILLGYDMRKTEGRAHWYPDRYKRGRLPEYQTPDDTYAQKWVPCMQSMAPIAKKAGMLIINCTPGSALDCFPHADLKDWV